MSLKKASRPSLIPSARGALQRRGLLLPRCVVQVASTSDVMMAALAQLAEQVATFKNGSADPHLLRPLPFLIYLADGDTVRSPSPTPSPLAAPLASLAVPLPLPRRPAAAHPLPFPPAVTGAR